LTNLDQEAEENSGCRRCKTETELRLCQIIIHRNFKPGKAWPMSVVMLQRIIHTLKTW